MSHSEHPINRPITKGRGAQTSPTNRFEKIEVEKDWSELDDDEANGRLAEKPETEFLIDRSESIVSENNSPDLNFRYSLNPYRGCEHGCSYCYARPTHEYLGFSAGVDFESKVVVKPDAARLFRKWLSRKAYEVDSIAFSGVTDCYQPAERKFQLTRQCIEVAAECGQPISIVTKNALIKRDLDLLSEMAARRIFRAAISLTSLDKNLAQKMEPRTSTPEGRLKAIESLSEAGIPVMVMVAPIIPGLNDHEVPQILQAAANAGARSAAYVSLRLPFAVKDVFSDWLETHFPDRSEKVLGRVREMRGGNLNTSEFGERMRGRGPIAEQIKATFELFQKKHKLDQLPEPLDKSQFHPPETDPRQKRLF